MLFHCTSFFSISYSFPLIDFVTLDRCFYLVINEDYINFIILCVTVLKLILFSKNSNLLIL